MYPYIYQSPGLTIGSYGLLLAIAYLIGRWYFLNQLGKSAPEIKNSEILIIMLLVIGVIGAKLMFILKNPEKSALLLSGTGFSSQGAIIGALIATYLFTFYQKAKLYKILDSAAPAAILAYAIARIGCFLSGDDCHGIPSELPWAMSFPEGIEQTLTRVHPVPLYEVIYSFIIFALLLTRQRSKTKPFSQFFTLLGMWGVCRFMVEFVTTNPKIVFFMTGSQFGALIMALSALIYFWVNYKKIN